MDAPRPMKLYGWLSQLRLLRTYERKLLFTAFVGTHIPLIACIGYVLLSNFSFAYVWPVLAVVLTATLAGTALTLWALHQLLAPVHATSAALSAYLQDGTLPDLPTSYDDAVGRLMAHTKRVVSHMDRLIQFKNRMMGVVSHDTRGPATSIVLGCEVLAERLSAYPEHQNLSEIVANIESAAHHQVQIASSIIEMARDGESGVQLRMQTENLSDVLRRVRQRAERQARANGQRLVLRPSEPFTYPVWTDTGKLEQALQNLVENALKFTPKGGHIVLSFQEDAEEVRLAVKDNGPGISKDMQPSIFKAFTTTAPNSEEGSGLGLWIARTFTERLGGTLTLDSAEGAGATFTLTFEHHTLAPLPADAPDDASESPLQSEARKHLSV